MEDFSVIHFDDHEEDIIMLHQLNISPGLVREKLTQNTFHSLGNKIKTQHLWKSGKLIYWKLYKRKMSIVWTRYYTALHFH